MPGNDLNPDLEKIVISNNKKREDYINWDEYFMSIALLSGKRSKDPQTQVGACIVNEKNQIMGVGYNGMPRGLSDDDMPWGKGQANLLENKHLYVVHAELNSVLNINCIDIGNCRLYTTLFPCNECAKVIIQRGIREVVYLSDEKNEAISYKASRFMLEKANIQLKKYQSDRSFIMLQFTKDK